MELRDMIYRLGSRKTAAQALGVSLAAVNSWLVNGTSRRVPGGATLKLLRILVREVK